MLIGGADHVHSWTERGDLKNACQEEGRQEGHEEEEVTAPGCVGRGGGPITSPFSFPVSKRRSILMPAKKKAAKKKKK
jgi:hypothetical protein